MEASGQTLRPDCDLRDLHADTMVYMMPLEEREGAPNSDREAFTGEVSLT